jgi:hypothetical protein
LDTRKPNRPPFCSGFASLDFNYNIAKIDDSRTKFFSIIALELRVGEFFSPWVKFAIHITIKYRDFYGHSQFYVSYWSVRKDPLKKCVIVFFISNFPDQNSLSFDSGRIGLKNRAGAYFFNMKGIPFYIIFLLLRLQLRVQDYAIETDIYFHSTCRFLILLVRIIKNCYLGWDLF